MRRYIASIAVIALVVLSAVPAFAEAAKKPDATLKLSEGSVAVGIGWSWGSGVLTYKGKTYKFKVEGLSAGDVGVTKAEARGDVMNLKKLADFSGVYAAAAAGESAKKGEGVTALSNDKGVEILLKSATKGVDLKVAVEGLKLKLEK
jgi:hypothetical protein